MAYGVAISSILEKVASQDKDLRYMASSDLLAELQRANFRTDPDTERRICKAVRQQLEDKSGDISGMALRSLGLLVHRVSEARVEEMIKELCSTTITTPIKKDSHRDLTTIGLKTIVAEIQGGPLAPLAASTISSMMLEGVKKDVNDVVYDSLDILTELYAKFGGLLTAEHPRMVATLLPFLDDARGQARKKALHCLAALSTYMARPFLDELLSEILNRMKAPGLKAEMVCTYVQSLGQISRAVGYRCGAHLASAVSLVVKQCSQAGEADDELREYCLQALESFVLKAPHECRAQCPPILSCALSCLKHDPNYAGGEDDEGGEGMDEDGEGGDDDDEDGGSDDEAYSDDEDQSWKVRRAAAKTLGTLAAAFPDVLATIYAQAASDLVSKFQEREESVKGDVFSAYGQIIKQTAIVSRRYAAGDPASPLKALESDLPSVLKAVVKTLKEKSLKTRVSAFILLKDLALVVPGGMAANMKLLQPGITAALADKSSAASTLKIEALLFCRQALAGGLQGLEATQSKELTAVLKQLLTAVLPCVTERYYKVSAEALNVIAQLLLVIRPKPSTTTPTITPAAAIPLELAPMLPKLFTVLTAKLSAQDQDQEVKDAAISCAATAVAQLGDVLKEEAPAILRTLLERMKNETTRLTAVRAFGTISGSAVKVDLGGTGVLEPLVVEMTTYLRKAMRPLRQGALVTLEALVSKYSSELSPAICASIVEETATILVDSDLPLSALALQLLATITSTQGANIGTEKCLLQALDLLRSPLLTNFALECLEAFLSSLAASGSPSSSIDSILPVVLNTGKGGSAGSAASYQGAVAQCVAALLCSPSAPRPKVEEVVLKLVGEVGREGDISSQRLALLCLGEIGRKRDLSALPQVEAAISRSCQSSSEEIKGAASTALGGVACGNLPMYLPSLLQQIQGAGGDGKRQYLLLTALSEVITTLSRTTTAPSSTPTPSPKLSSQPSIAKDVPLELTTAQQSEILSLLLSCIPGGQEECRTIMAECLGRLALSYPSLVFEKLKFLLGDERAEMRGVAVSAIKYAVVEKPHPVDQYLQANLLPFLQRMDDPDRHVRRAGAVSLSAVAHQKPELVVQGGVLSEVLPLLYNLTAVREDLIKTIDLGPFKHKIDEGLEIRKAAFECIDILLDSSECAQMLNINTLLDHFQSGLGDDLDVRTPCHMMVAKLVAADPQAMVAGVEKLVPQLEKTLGTRLKSEPVKQEIDRHEELLRNCLRAVSALAQIPETASSVVFSTFMRRVVLVQGMKDKYAQVERERLEAEGAGSSGMDLS